MKKVISFVILFYTLISHAQSNDLATASTGNFMGFSALFNEDSQLFGYLAIYFKGKDSPITDTFEYVYFDKNLNKVANNDFTAPNYTLSYSSFINKKGEIELFPYVDNDKYYKAKKQTIWTSKIINLKTNTITDKPVMLYEEDKLIELDPETTRKERDEYFKKYLRANDFFPRSDIQTLKDGSILAVTYKNDPYKGYNFDYGIIKFDSNKNELWRYEFNKDKKSKTEQTISIIYFEDESVYLIETTTVKKDKTFKLLKINLKTGAKEIDLPLSNYSEESLKSLRIIDNKIGNVYNKRAFDDKVVFVGQDIKSLYQSFSEDYFRMIIDKKTNQVTFDNISSAQIRGIINSNNAAGKDGFNLIPRDLYFFEDGSVGFMFEKIKIGSVSVMGFGGKAKTTDLIYVETNENFSPKNVKVFEKEMTKGFTNSDYLFSQYGKEKDDVIFFYKDFQKEEDGDKNWNLFINTIRSGVISTEKIPISSKTNAIVPYVAKNGYILLREFNKDNKYNAIRLEKLNN